MTHPMPPSTYLSSLGYTPDDIAVLQRLWELPITRDLLAPVAQRQREQGHTLDQALAYAHGVDL